MISIEIPQRGLCKLHHAVFDINGTLAVDGVVLVGVADYLQTLGRHLSIHLLTAGTPGDLEEMGKKIGHPPPIIPCGEGKAKLGKKCGAESASARWNVAQECVLAHTPRM